MRLGKSDAHAPTTLSRMARFYQAMKRGRVWSIISTCFRRRRSIWRRLEDDEDALGIPAQERMKGVEFSVQKGDRRLREDVRARPRRSKDAMRVAQFRELAANVLTKKCAMVTIRMRSAPVARERKVWIRNRLTGTRRRAAKFWAGPTSTPTRNSLGEQLSAAETEIVRGIVRPRFVESGRAIRFPDGTKALPRPHRSSHDFEGQRQLPANPKLILTSLLSTMAAVMLRGYRSGLRRMSPSWSIRWRPAIQILTTWKGSSVSLVCSGDSRSRRRPTACGFS